MKCKDASRQLVKASGGFSSKTIVFAVASSGESGHSNISISKASASDFSLQREHFLLCLYFAVTCQS
jgi:hypothetical protein